MSQLELAAYVQTHLAARGIQVVLSGGTAVSFYVGSLYTSKDIDLIADWFPKSAHLNEAMNEIGFTLKNKYFVHAQTTEVIEVLPGPITAGEEHLTRVNEIKLPTGTLRLLTPTDCTKERLAAYLHWNDTQSLEQALWIAQLHKVDLEEIKRWATKERGPAKFKVFLARLNDRSTPLP
jgi:hypothetical protein